MATRRALLLATLACSCGHAPRWDAGARRLTEGAIRYRVGPLGSTWQMTHLEEGAVTFWAPAIGGVISADATCRDDADAASLESLTAHLLVGWTGRRQERRELVTLAGRAALHSVIAARLDGVPMVLEVYVLKRNGCIYDLSYAAPPERRAEGEADFARFVAGFVDEREA